MHILPPTSRSLDLAVRALADGGLVVHPTETCYGIACDLTNPAAVARLFALKQRPGNQPVSALFSSIAQAKRYVLWNSKADPFVKQHLPGPLTLILPLRPDAPHALFPVPLTMLSGVSFQVSGDANKQLLEAGSWKLEATLGIRISSHPVAQKLVTLFGRPISTTSANISRKPPTYSVEEIIAQFGGHEGAQDTLILDVGPLPRRSPSTIIDVTGASPREIRKGVISTEMEGA